MLTQSRGRVNRRADSQNLTLRAAAQHTNKSAEAGLAQLVEHLICNQGVTSSNLVTGTIFPNQNNSIRQA